MKPIQSKTILFITGAFVGSNCWDEWKVYFESHGFHCLAPPWPHKNAPPATLRNRHPDAEVASNRLKDLVGHYAAACLGLPEKPILIGHSLGGLITQLLIQKDLAAAGVAIHSAPPQGVLPTQVSFYKANLKSLGFFTSSRKTYMISFPAWQYAFTNGMTEDEQKKAYEEFAIPESKLALRDGLTSAARVDFTKPHSPLLFIAGSQDQCIPAGLNQTNFRRYRDKTSITEFKEFQGRNHFVLGQPGWKEVADYILQWLSSNSSTA